MSPQARGPDAAAAGELLIGSIALCAVAGFGIGSLVDLGVPLGPAGLFAGFVAGMALVHARYRRI